MRRLRRWMWRGSLALTVLALLAGIAVMVVLRTQWLRQQVRSRIILEVEKATGGKVELKQFDFDPGTLRASVHGFILRGKEDAGEAPLASVERIEVGVKVVSFLSKIAYLETLEVSKPLIRIVTYEDGSTNIPGPKIKRADSKTVFEQFVALSARKFVLKDGLFIYDNERVPLSLMAENLSVEFGWEKEGPRYRGIVKAAPFHFQWPQIGPLQFDTNVELTMDKSGLVFQKAELRQGKSVMNVKGEMQDYRSPKVEVDVDGRFAMAEYMKTFRLPLSPEGAAQFQGHFSFADGVYGLKGKLQAQDLAVREKSFTVAPAALTTDVELTPKVLKMANLAVRTLGGTLTGSAEIRDYRDFTVNGVVQGFSLEELRQVEKRHRPVAWSGEVSGPMTLSGTISRNGVRNLDLGTHFAIQPLEGKIPIEGIVNGRYQVDENVISFQSSYLKTPATRVDFTGAVGEAIQVLFESSDLNEMLPAIALATDEPPEALPVQLDGGRMRFEGKVTSPLVAQRIQGKVNATNVQYQQHKLDAVSGDVDIDQSRVFVQRLALKLGESQVEGDVQVSLLDWKAQAGSAVGANLELRQASLEELLKGRKTPVELRGIVSGPIRVAGTFAAPIVGAKLTVTKAAIAEELFERIQMEVQYRPELIEVKSGLAVHAAGSAPFQFRYEHAADDYERGKVTFEVSARNALLSAVQVVRQQRPDLDARVDVQAKGILVVEKGQPGIDRIDGTLALREIALNRKPLGSLSIEAKTQGERAVMTATGELLKSPIKGRGEWQLTGDANGLGELELGTLTLAKLNEILKSGEGAPVPFEGRFNSVIVVSGALRKPSTLKARANLTQVELTPRTDTGQLSAQVLDELRLRNTGPIIIELDVKGFQITQAQFVGKDTNIGVSGTVATGARNAWNVVLKGGLNLGIFQNYVAGLRTSGTAEVNATVRGTLAQPLLGGRMEIKDANISHRDLPNSIDKAKGFVVFDRNRALLQNFVAQSGGGELKLSGFVTFGGDEEITYRLNGQLDKVRIRYPEGVSTTANANLSLTGTADQSLLSGVVTIMRSGFRQRTDFGSLLLEPAKPIPVPTGSSLLRGMQFDVRLKSAPNLQLETSLTTGLQATVDLRVKGSPLKPVLLGTVGLNQGELNFFGTTYTITRGTVSFFNAARIEPVLDLDFETVVRAVTVNMTVSGPIDKPNITYRSDPPLQSGDIIALLAVGRTPANSTVATATQTNVGGASNGFYAGTDTLLGQALSAGVSGRLQRFFGVSRVKIDPQLVGLDTTPQARLTIEQQISKAVTLTYVTNLTGTLQQLVRLQWDLTKNWSITGVRDENGVIGSDVQYRKRFK